VPRRLALVLVVLPLVAAACTSSGGDDTAGAGPETTATSTATTPAGTASRATLAHASERTTAAGSARYTLSVVATLSGAAIETHSRGSVSFRRRRAHVFKLVPGLPYPQEEIVDGPVTYRNSNIVAALSDPSQKPWTKVDTSRLPAARQLAELDHVRTLAYLPAGARSSQRVGTSGALTHFRGEVDPEQLLARVPARQRPTIQAVLHADYADGRFPADFWLDDRSRLRRVRVSYTTGQGSRFTLVGTFSAFGSPVDVTPPPARATEVVAP
jgi:hypothetical protein